MPAATQTLDTRIGALEFEGGYPTDATVQTIYDELDFQRAVQAYLWALPMASYGAMADAHRETGAGTHAVIVADKSAEQQQLLLTANQDTIYMSGVLDLREGPMVMELPAGLLETLGIAHKRPFEPDERLRRILTEAAEVGRATAKTLAWNARIPDELLYAFPGERKQKYIFFGDPTFHTPDYMAIDQRAKYAFEAIGTSKSMVVAVPGQGSQYAGSTRTRVVSG